MPLLSTGKILENYIYKELQAIAPTSDDPAVNQSVSDGNRATAKAISKGIIAWLKDKKVNLDVIDAQVPPGIAVATAGSPSAQTGSTTTAGKVILGKLK